MASEAVPRGTRGKEEGTRKVFQLFGQMLEYPRPGLARAVRECEALVSPSNPEAGALLREFGTFAEKNPLGRLEEVFSGAFDVDAFCYPYVGYHLFGESYKRSVFMLGLKERYRAFNFAIPGNELPDHLAVIVRFLGVCDDAAETEEIVSEALLPTLKRMTGKGAEEPSEGISAENPSTEGPNSTELRATNAPPPKSSQMIYHNVLNALRLILQSLPDSGRVPATVAETTTD